MSSKLWRDVGYTCYSIYGAAIALLILWQLQIGRDAFLLSIASGLLLFDLLFLGLLALAGLGVASSVRCWRQNPLLVMLGVVTVPVTVFLLNNVLFVYGPWVVPNDHVERVGLLYAGLVLSSSVGWFVTRRGREHALRRLRIAGRLSAASLAAVAFSFGPYFLLSVPISGAIAGTLLAREAEWSRRDTVRAAAAFGFAFVLPAVALLGDTLAYMSGPHPMDSTVAWAVGFGLGGGFGVALSRGPFLYAVLGFGVGGAFGGALSYAIVPFGLLALVVVYALRKSECPLSFAPSGCGTQYLSIRYTERLAEAGIESSVDSRGDWYDNALAETIIGLYKTEVIRSRGPWRHMDAVEYATLEWVDWFNHRRLLEPIGNVPPTELELAYLSPTGRVGYGGLTQTNGSPENPERLTT